VNDSTPTERIDSLGQTSSSNTPRGLLIALIAVGAAVLVAIVIVILLLLGKNSAPSGAPVSNPSESPSASAEATPSETPTATVPDEPSASPAPTTAPSTAPAFSTFTAPSKEDGCYYSDAPSYTPPTVHVTVTWRAVNAQSVWFVQGTSDAADSMFMEVPLAGDQDDFPYPFDFQCGSDSNTYTMTIVGNDGTHKSKTWKVKNTGDKY
jgi:cytoskeletal protein RodZ